MHKKSIIKGIFKPGTLHQITVNRLNTAIKIYDPQFDLEAKFKSQAPCLPFSLVLSQNGEMGLLKLIVI